VRDSEIDLPFQVKLHLTLSTTVMTRLGFWGPLALRTRLFLRRDCGGGDLGMGSVVLPFDFEAFMLIYSSIEFDNIKAPLYALSILIIVQLRLAGLKKEL
jgi:hypothetical protein